MCYFISFFLFSFFSFSFFSFFFFFIDTATTEIYTLSLHDALPICSSSATIRRRTLSWNQSLFRISTATADRISSSADRKSTRLNSSHTVISYAVFCLKKKKKNKSQK